MSLAELLEDAMKLAPDDRAALAHELLASLETDAAPQEELSEEWVAVIRKRMADMDRGEAVLRCDPQELIARICARLREGQP
jgi:hypothetical protein